MAKIGIKGLTYATYSSGGEGSAMVYTGGATIADLMVRANVTIDREDVSQYADNKRVEHANGVIGASLEVELAKLPDAIKTALLGYESGTDGLAMTEEETPYVGFGYITKEINGGTPAYVGHWFYKVQFGINSDSFETKGETTAFGTDTINGTAMGVSLSASAATRYYVEKSESTEAAARSWLNTLAGITNSVVST